VGSMAIARFPSIVIDCPDPAALATFYGTMLDWKTEVRPGWAEVRAEYGQCITFHQVQAYTPPKWPGQQVPQQMHLDVIVDDLDAAEAAVLDLGATKHENQPGTSFRVFLDPSGHPFCLCVD
jgi:predicted enzyme related to lactoylglutathione lyase